MVVLARKNFHYNEDVFQLWMKAYLRLLFLKNKNNNNNIVNETDTYLHEIS